MSNDNMDSAFWDRADNVIRLANEQCESAQRSKVSASLLYATARFNAFIVAGNANNAEEMKQDKEDAVQYFIEQYRKMLVENLDDYIKNFSKYVGR
jgi:hypothetical protein